MSIESLPTVLVLGANGRLGHASAGAFARAGWRVLAQSRRPLVAGLPAQVQRLDAPLDDQPRLRREAAGATVVVHALNPDYTRWPQELLPLARQGMDLAEALGARFMLPGNVYNYGAGHMPSILRPATPQGAVGRKGRLRIELEGELQSRAAQGRLRSVVIRAGDFYGGLPGSWLDLVIARSWRQGRLVYPGPMNLPHAWAYLPDLACAFEAVARQTHPAAFERLHFEGHTLTGAQLLAAIESAAADLGAAAAQGWRHKGFPWWPVMGALGWAVPMWRELHEMRYLWTTGHALDGTALTQAVGPLPGTPVVSAMRAALEVMEAGQGSPAGAAA